MSEASQPIQTNNVPNNTTAPANSVNPVAFQITSKHIMTALICVVVAIVTYYAYEFFVKNQAAESGSVDKTDADDKRSSSQEVQGYSLHESLRRIVDRQKQINSTLSNALN